MRLLGAWLGGSFVVAFLAFGGVHHASRAVLHALLAVAAALAAALPAHVLEKSGRTWLLLGAGGALLVAALAGFAPIPWSVASVVAPGLQERFPDFLVRASTVDPEATLDAVGHLLLVVTAATCVSVWCVASWRRGLVDQAVRVAAVALPVVALAHAWAGTTALFGRIPTALQPPYRFFAPFIDHNHAGSALLLCFPFVLAEAADAERSRSSRLAHGALAALMTFALFEYGSTGPLAIAGLQALVVGVRRRTLSVPVVAALGAVGLGAAVAFDVWTDPGHQGDLHGRLGIWCAAVRLFADHWLLGSGAGTFAEAIGPYRHDVDWVTWDHAHAEYLEWATETGVLGVACAVLAAVLLARPATRDADRAFPLTLGALGVLLHGLVDFPLRVPALAMSVAALLGVKLTLYAERRPSSPWVLRGALAGLVCANVAGCAWQVRDRSVQAASDALWHGTGDQEAAARTLRWMGPWRPELRLYDAREALADGRNDRAEELATEVTTRDPDDPLALRTAAAVLLEAGAPDAARAAADRAVEEGPWDWTNHVARARIVTRTAPSEAPEAWRQALAAGASPSVYPEAWAVLPVGLYWVDAVDGAPDPQDAALARFLARMDDPEAAALAYEQALLADPDAVFPGYVDVLLKLDRIDDADRHLARGLASSASDPDWLRRLALVRERQQRWREASDAWLAASRDRRSDQVRAIRDLEQGEGDEAALALIRRLDLQGKRLDDKVILERARLQGRLGQRDDCVTELRSSGLLDRMKAPAARQALASCSAPAPAPAAPSAPAEPAP